MRSVSSRPKASEEERKDSDKGGTDYAEIRANLDALLRSKEVDDASGVINHVLPLLWETENFSEAGYDFAALFLLGSKKYDVYKKLYASHVFYENGPGTIPTTDFDNLKQKMGWECPLRFVRAEGRVFELLNWLNTEVSTE